MSVRDESYLKKRVMCTNVDIYVFIRLSLTNVFSLSIYKLEHHNDGIVLAYGA